MLDAPPSAAEHMVFMGSTRFPGENELDEYVSSHGGCVNAYTELEATVSATHATSAGIPRPLLDAASLAVTTPLQTPVSLLLSFLSYLLPQVYQLEVTPGALPGALDRLASMLASPLFRRDAVDREVRAIHSEFAQALSDDASRLDQLECGTHTPGPHFQAAAASAGAAGASSSSAAGGGGGPGCRHPLSTFCWGNRASLVDAPAVAQLDALTALKGWYAQHYLGATHRWHAVVRSDGTRLPAYAQQKQKLQAGTEQDGAAAVSEGGPCPPLDAVVAEDARVALDALEAAVRLSFEELEKATRRSRKRGAVAAATQARVAKGRAAKGKGGKGAASPASPSSAPSPSTSGTVVTAVEALNTLLGRAISALRPTGPRPPHCVTDVAPAPGTAASAPLLPALVGWSPYTPYLPLSSGPSSGTGAGASPSPAGTPLPRPWVHLSLPRSSSHQLCLGWRLPPLLSWYWHRPEQVIGDLLGHEARGTILALLKTRGWANEIQCGLDRRQGHACNSIGANISVDVTLTEAGVAAWREVVGVVCAYVTHVLCGGVAVGAAAAGSAPAALTGGPALSSDSVEASGVARGGSTGGGGPAGKRRRGASSSSQVVEPTRASAKRRAKGGDGPASVGASADAASAGAGAPFSLECDALLTVGGTPVPRAILASLASHARSLQWVHDETAALEAVGYHHADEDAEPLEQVTGIAAAMAAGASDAAILPAGAGLMGPYAPETVAVLLAHLVPSKMRVDLSSSLVGHLVPSDLAAALSASAKGAAMQPAKGAPAAATATSSGDKAPRFALTPSESATLSQGIEPWFGIPFARLAADEACVADWTSPAPLHALALPPRNPFIPTDLSVRPLPQAGAEGSAAASGQPGGADDSLPAFVAAAVRESLGLGAPGTASGDEGAHVPALPPHIASFPREIVTEALQLTSTPTSDSSSPPLLIGRLWHKQDDVFRVPRSHVRVALHLPALYTLHTDDAPARPLPAAGHTASPAAGTAGAASAGPLPGTYPAVTSSQLLALLHASHVGDDLNETLYHAELALIDCTVRAKLAGTGLTLRCDGPSHKLPEVLAAVVARLTSPSSPLLCEGEAAGSACSASPSPQFTRLLSGMRHSIHDEVLDPSGQAAAVAAGALVAGKLVTAEGGASAALTTTAAAPQAGTDASLPRGFILNPTTAAVEGSSDREAAMALLGPEGGAIDSPITPQLLSAFTGGSAAGGDVSLIGSHRLWGPARPAADVIDSTTASASSAPAPALRPIVIEMLVHGNEDSASASALYRCVADAVARSVASAAAETGLIASPGAVTLQPVPPSQRASLDLLYPPRPTARLEPGTRVIASVPSASPQETNNVVSVSVFTSHWGDAHHTGAGGGGSSGHTGAPAAPPSGNDISPSTAVCPGLHAHPTALAAAAAGPPVIPPTGGPPSFPWVVRRARLKVLEELLTEPLFDALRTKQQLGYTVSTSSQVSDACGLLSFHIVSSSHSCGDVSGRLDEFLRGFRARLVAMDDAPAAAPAAAPQKDEGEGGAANAGATAAAAAAAPGPTPFGRHLRSLIEGKLQRDTSLEEETDRHWEEVRSRRRLFGRLALEVAALAGGCASLGDVVRLWDECIAPSSPPASAVGSGALAVGGTEGASTRRLTVHVAGRGFGSGNAAPKAPSD